MAFCRELLPDRSPGAIKLRRYRLRRRRMYFVSPHAVRRYWARVDPSTRSWGMGPVQQLILNELQHARFRPLGRLSPTRRSIAEGLEHWPLPTRTRHVLAECRHFRAVISPPPEPRPWPAVSTILEPA